MTGLFDNDGPQGPVELARRSVRQPALRKRFYETAEAVPEGDAFAVRLDGKPVRTPAGRALAAPTLPLAQAIADEWQAQRDVIDPSKMPLTRLANSIIDGVCDRPRPVAEEVEKYLGSDLLCYRAGEPSGLVERQRRAWDPVLDWAAQTLGARMSVSDGIVFVAQPDAALAAARAAIPEEPWRLGAVNTVTALGGSALLALALLRGRLTAEEVWLAAHVDEDWNIERWGQDEEALARRAFRFAELKAAETVLRLR